MKSMLAMNIAVAVAGGSSDVLGHEVIRTGKVL